MDVPHVAPPARSAPPLDLVPAPRQRRLYGWFAWVPIVLGAWLIVATVLWPQTLTSRTTSVLFGLAFALVGAVALYKPWLRKLNAWLAVWFGVMALAIEHYVDVDLANQVIVAVAVLIAAVAEVRTSARPQDAGHGERSGSRA